MAGVGGVAPGPGDTGYRAWLDGLRAVAVYLVVVFHAGVAGWAGGFVGVDVFFVLSGFLVTRLLLKDLTSEAGRVGYGRFYARRFRRLLPAAFVVLVITALVYAALASPVEIADAVGGFKAAFLYVANWYFIDQAADYFGADLATNPVLQFWSLAVEEQFYLAWPLLLGGLFAITRRFGRAQWRIRQGTILTAGILSLAWAWSLRNSDPSRAYYGTDARAYQLLAGALLALTPGLIGRFRRYARAAGWVALAAIAGIVLVASSATNTLDPIQRGTAVTALTVVILIGLETTTTGPARWGLSLAPIVYLGKISYGTYLWHWPVILIITRTFGLSPWSTTAYTVVVATALASLSYQLLEHPIRLSQLLDRHRYPVIATGLATSALSALLLIPNILQPTTTRTPITTTTATSGFIPVPSDLDYSAIKSNNGIKLPDCLAKPASACTIATGDGASILLIGDSHAGMLIPAFLAIAEEHDLTLSVSARLACPWQRDLYVVPQNDPVARRKACERAKEDTYNRLLDELDPDVVVAMNLGYERGEMMTVLGPDGDELLSGSAELEDWIEETTTRSLAELRAGGRKVVLLDPIPYAGDGFNPLSCLSEAEVVDECRYVADPTRSSLEALYRELDAADDQVWSLDLDGLVCPFLPICDPIVNGVVVNSDFTHLTSSFVKTLAPDLYEYLIENGVLR
ncbi:MAG: acyltransferase [Acidimicrobiia bacterium]|nr:acyltransferase [Acidimicrobiia bacterium]